MYILIDAEVVKPQSCLPGWTFYMIMMYLGKQRYILYEPVAERVKTAIQSILSIGNLEGPNFTRDQIHSIIARLIKALSSPVFGPGATMEK